MRSGKDLVAMSPCQVTNAPPRMRLVSGLSWRLREMEVGIDGKKAEERESAMMRTSQLGGLVGYVRIFSIICSLMCPRAPQNIHWRIPGSGPSDTSHHRRDRIATLRVLLPFLQTKRAVISGICHRKLHRIKSKTIY